MSSLLIAALSFSVSQVLLSLLLLYREPAWGLRERLFALLMLALLGYIASPMVQGTALSLPISVLQTAAPGVFWLFSYSLFDDSFRLRVWQVGLVAFTVFMPVVGSFAEGARWLYWTLPQAVEFALLGAALYVVARNWRSDLVEARRRLRIWFVGLCGSYSFLLLFSREILFPGADWLATWEYLPLCLLLLAINASLLRYHRGLLFQVESVPVGASAPVPTSLDSNASLPDGTETTAEEPGDSPVNPAVLRDPEAVAKLEAFMREHRVWQEMGLTIGQLAEKLDTPQYRLREVINQGLGYRNFNDFLNSYRIAEAADRLADAEQSHIPVLTIAMDAGFRSLSAFNKAFKATFDRTPTAWRKQQLS